MRYLGIDEAGRGPVIGPLVIGAVMVDEEGRKALEKIGVKDSKALNPERREELEKEIKSIAIDYAVVKISAEELNREMEARNLNRIEMLRFAEIINLLEPDIAVIDAPEANTEKFLQKFRPLVKVDCRIIAENRADAKYPEVAAASILAKVERDREIRRIEEETGISIGSGYPSDERAVTSLEEMLEKAGKYVRKKWSTVKRIEEKRKVEGLGKWLERGE